MDLNTDEFIVKGREGERAQKFSCIFFVLLRDEQEVG